MKKTLLALIILITLQIQAQCWKQVAAGNKHTLAIKDDGTLWAWGNNDKGQLGVGNTDPVSGMVQIGTDNDWIEISAAYQISVAIKNNGTLWHWGTDLTIAYSESEMLSNYNSLPVQIGVETYWKSVSCGDKHVLARTNEGILWVWGSNSKGELGNGTNEPAEAGIHKLGDEIYIFSVVGFSHNMAIKSDGTLWMWGDNQFKQQTQNGLQIVKTPTKLGNDTDWQSASGSMSNTLAIKTDGTLWGWGDNSSGQIGDGTTFPRNFPVQINTDTDWKIIAINNSASSSAIKQDGSLWSWGAYYWAGTGTNQGLFTSPVNIISNEEFVSISKGYNFTMAISSNEEMYGWGQNTSGEINNSEQEIFFEPLAITCNATASLNDNALSQITLYPNPTSNTLTLANAENLNIESITVTDLTGKTVLSKKGNNSQVNVEVLPAGIYFLNVSAQEGVQHLKFIKE